MTARIPVHPGEPGQGTQDRTDGNHRRAPPDGAGLPELTPASGCSDERSWREQLRRRSCAVRPRLRPRPVPGAIPGRRAGAGPGQGEAADAGLRADGRGRAVLCPGAGLFAVS